MSEGEVTPMNPPAAKEEHVIFRSSASYHSLFGILVAFAPTACLVSMYFVWTDDASTRDEKEGATRGLLWTIIALLIVFVLVLPRRFEVVSNASVNVVSVLGWKWNFGDVCGAFDQQSVFAEWYRPKFKFAVDIHNRVIVKRRNGKWDVLVSPRDAAGFVDAVWNVVNENDNGIVAGAVELR